MEMKPTKPARSDSRRGSALIMVVVLTVLLAVIGVLFVMASRIDEMATSSVVYDRELDYAVESVVELISQRLTDDLMGGVDERGVVDERSFDSPGIRDNWLSTIEPESLGDNGTPADYTDDIFAWPHLSDITGDIRAAGWIGLFADIYSSADANDVVPADADGDGVVDSLWVRLPDVTTGRGRPVFAAVRIIDNCGMLNLNTAHTLAPGSEGRYLSEVDYERFLRGTDRQFNYDAIRYARQGGPRPLPPLIDLPDVYHHNAIMHIENPGPDYALFDIGDELEIRNRFLLTSLFEARFERLDVANYTLDAGGGIYGSLQIPVEPGIAGYFDAGTSFPYTHFDKWKWRLDPNNFDDTSGAWVAPGIPIDYRFKYDRRHVCTFYSFDRNLRLGMYRGHEGVPPIRDDAGNPLLMIFDPDPVAVCTRIAEWDPAIMPAGGYNYNNVETRVQILKLLYAFRAYSLAKYPTENFKEAARGAAQVVANMIDYVDDNNPLTEGPFFDPAYGGQTNDNPTYIDRNVIRQLIWEVSGYLSGGLNAIDIDVAAQYDFGIGVTDPNETIYGYERQPFISEIVRYDDGGGTTYYAIELCNPYENPNGAIDLNGWRIKIGSDVYPLASGALWQGSTLEVEPATGSRVPGRAVIVSDVQIVNPVASFPVLVIEVAGMTIPAGTVVELQRPDPARSGEFITVDKTEAAQADYINGDTDWRSSKRDDTKWKFTNAGSYAGNSVRTLGRPNAVSLTPDGYQMPVADDNVPIGTLGDFVMVLRVGNEKGGDPNTVTEHVAAASDEGDVRTDVASGPPYPLDYVCFVGRPEGTLPGRINVNTATKEVIRAAIDPNSNWNPDYEVLANNIVDNRPFERVADLLSVGGFKQFAADAVGVGDPDMRGDFEERDWILSRVANKLTVRSDVFTAYILVRLGYDGPERRMIAIFDRSNVYKPADPRAVPEKPRIIALHPVGDPR
ncbi:MAG: hypothetical protein DRP66_01980 [Planctomycetota bacterium]|nr:MAG: hypothetical protein DRP66_01980 [Planctomycetota bacterium]